MTGSKPLTTPSKNRYGNYVKQKARARANLAPTIHNRIISPADKDSAQSPRNMVGATLAVALSWLAPALAVALPLPALAVALSRLAPALAARSGWGRVHSELAVA